MSADLTHYENGRTWIVVGHEDDGEYSRRIDYLLSGNRRRSVFVLATDDSFALRLALGRALEEGRTGLGKGASSNGRG